MQAKPRTTHGRISNRLLDRLVADAAPVVDERLAALEDLALSLDLLGERVVATRRPGPGGGRRRRRALVLAFVALLLASATAVGAMYTTHTGFFPRPGTENDSTELLRTDAPDFPPLVEKLVRRIPFPPGSASLSARVATYVSEVQPGPDRVPNTVQAAQPQVQMSLWAVCAWRGYWLSEYRAGDRERQALAAGRLFAVGTAAVVKRHDSFWRVYVAVARRESTGDPSAPIQFEAFYRVNCTGPQPWRAR